MCVQRHAAMRVKCLAAICMQREYTMYNSTYLKTYKRHAVSSILADMWPKYHTKSTTTNSNGICASCVSSVDVASIHCCYFDDLILMHCKRNEINIQFG